MNKTNWDTSQVEGADSIKENSLSVNLYTAYGDFVANVPVIPFVNPPKVLIWGSRIFVATEVVCPVGHPEQDGELVCNYPIPVPYRIQYREDLGYHIQLFYEEGEGWFSPYGGQAKKEIKKALDVRGLEFREVPEELIEKALAETFDQTACAECHFIDNLHKTSCPVFQSAVNETKTEIEVKPDAMVNGDFCPECKTFNGLHQNSCPVLQASLREMHKNALND